MLNEHQKAGFTTTLASYGNKATYVVVYKNKSKA